MLYIAADHGGFELKQKLIAYLTSQNIAVKDLGAHDLNSTDDYPDFVVPLVKNVLADIENGMDSKGIVICRNGVGVSMHANKFAGIRCALSWNPKHAKSARKDDNANVLALGADYLDDQQAQEIVHTWLDTTFEQEERHMRRLQKIDATIS